MTPGLSPRARQAIRLAEEGLAPEAIASKLMMGLTPLRRLLAKHGPKPERKPAWKPQPHQQTYQPRPICRACGGELRDPATGGCAFCEGIRRSGIRPA